MSEAVRSQSVLARRSATTRTDAEAKALASQVELLQKQVSTLKYQLAMREVGSWGWLFLFGFDGWFVFLCVLVAWLCGWGSHGMAWDEQVAGCLLCWFVVLDSVLGFLASVLVF